MSSTLIGLVFETNLAPTMRLVALALADHGGSEGEIYPSVARLERRTGLSERAIRSALADLRDRGIIVLRAEPEVVAGVRRGRRYEMSPEALARAVDNSSTPAPRAPAGDAVGAADAGGGVQHVPRRGAGDAPKPRTEPRTEPRTKKPATASPSKPVGNRFVQHFIDKGGSKTRAGQLGTQVKAVEGRFRDEVIMRAVEMLAVESRSPTALDLICHQLDRGAMSKAALGSFRSEDFQNLPPGWKEASNGN